METARGEPQSQGHAGPALAAALGSLSCGLHLAGSGPPVLTLPHLQAAEAVLTVHSLGPEPLTAAHLPTPSCPTAGCPGSHRGH